MSRYFRNAFDAAFPISAAADSTLGILARIPEAKPPPTYNPEL